MTDRRAFILTAAAAAAWPLVGSAQTPQRVVRIGTLETSAATYRGRVYAAFHDELRQRGYVEGRNLLIERRDAAGQVDRLPALAAELVALRPDLIVASAPQPNRALKNATSTGALLPTSTSSSTEPSPPICRSNSPPGSSWSST